MGIARMVLGSTLRTRWRASLLLVFLVAVASGATLAALGTARRTENAFPGAIKAEGRFDLSVESSLSKTTISHLPAVQSDSRFRWYGVGIGTIGGHTYLGPTSYAALAPPGRAVTRCASGLCSFGSFRMKLLSGHLPDASSPGGVLVDYAMAQLAHLHVGSDIRETFYSASAAQARALSTGGTPEGPTVTFRVAGIVVFRGSFRPPPYGLIFTTPAFVGFARGRILEAPLDLVTLHNPADATRFEAALAKRVGGFANAATITRQLREDGPAVFDRDPRRRFRRRDAPPSALGEPRPPAP